MPAKDGRAVNGKVLTREDLLKVLAPVQAETVEVEVLGGAVRVQPMGLTAWLWMISNSAIVKREGDPLAQYRLSPYLLAFCVVDAAGEPLMAPAEWERFGAVHRDAAADLLLVAQRLCGLQESQEKKDSRRPS